jgi:starch synthase
MSAHDTGSANVQAARLSVSRPIERARPDRTRAGPAGRTAGAATMARMPIRVVFVAAECEPWAKTGGLADVVDALARAIGDLDGDPVAPVDVFMPRYAGLGARARGPARPIHVPDPLAAGGVTEVGVLDVAGDGYRLRLVEHPPAFDRPGIYGEDGRDYADNAWRFGLLCRAVLETLRADRSRVDLLHLHDWHAVPALLSRDRRYDADPLVGRAAVLLTVHNLAYQGWTPADRLAGLALGPGNGIVPDGATGLNLLAAGVERADLVNTVSPGFAAEALTPEFGNGLDGLLRSRGDRFFGIQNGLDTTDWDPATDMDIAAPYARADRAGKAACRADLLGRIGFDPADPGPVFAMIGRLDPQKGFDLLAEAAPALVDHGARLVALGDGDRELADALRAVAATRPRRVALVETFDRALARRIYAGADIFVMPSRFEPSGLGQLIALRYGTPPVVRRTGGLRDTVVDEFLNPGRGTGFAFDHPTADGLLWACAEALDAFADRDRWRGIVDRGMAADFSWSGGSAVRYVEAYRRAISIRAAQQ